MTNPWRQVRFNYVLGVVALFDVVIYILYILARLETEEYRLLNWFLMGAIAILLLSYVLNPFETTEGIETEWQDSSSIVLAGFFIMIFLQIGLDLAFELIHKFSLLDQKWLALFLGVHVAIWEEIMRFSLLRIIGGQVYSDR